MTFFELSYATLFLVVALIGTIFIYFKCTYQYWQRRNLNYLKPTIPWGNFFEVFNGSEPAILILKQHYNSMKAKGWKHGGVFVFTTPIYMPIDLDYIKNILTKDFQYFVNRGLYNNERDDPMMGAHLLGLEGSKWKRLRNQLSPTFTPGKMKMMFHTLIECVPSLLHKIETDCITNAPINITGVSNCFTIDVIGSVAFGLDIHSLNEENSPFREYGEKASDLSILQLMKFVFALLYREAAKSLRLIITRQDVTNFFVNLVKDTVAYREKNKSTRNDFLQILIGLRNKFGDEIFSTTKMAAHSFAFFIAGFDTSAAAMTFALYELAQRPDLQERIKEEIDTVLLEHDGKLTYEALQDMKYMDQVIDETLRMHPPGTILLRKCGKDYKVPNENVIIEKGTFVPIPILAIHYDPEYYPEPEKFDPDRFTEENKNNRHPYSYLPFGEGPRQCIGMRFGLMQTKVGLISLLKDFRFTVNGKTQQPLKIKTNSTVFLTVEGHIWLNVERR